MFIYRFVFRNLFEKYIHHEHNNLIIPLSVIFLSIRKIKKEIMKRLFSLPILFLFVSQFSLGQNLNTILSNEIDSLLSADFQESTIAAAEICNLTEGRLIYSRESKLLLRPASNMKILTSAAALYFLQPDYQFVTKLYYDGEISSGVLKGNLYIKGGFDPDFTSEDLEEFVTAVMEAGIETIEGNIYADISLSDNKFWGEGWMWDDDPYSDFPYMTSLNINDASVMIEIKPTTTGSKALVKIYPHSLFYTFENNLLTDTVASDYTVQRDWMHRKNHFIISGVINVEDKPDTVKRNLVNTDRYAATLLKEALYREGILTFGIIDTTTTPENAVLLNKVSRRFDEVILNLNKMSDNLSAEMTLRALGGLIKKNRISAEDGVVFIDSLVKIVGHAPGKYRIVDGSGVSHYNLISAELIAGILKYFYYEEPELYRILRNSFPIAGVDGTLKYRMKEGKAFNNVHAKTGTLSGVSTLSGYLKNGNGEDIAFSILVQNFVGSSRNARKLQDIICEILAGYKK